MYWAFEAGFEIRPKLFRVWRKWLHRGQSCSEATRSTLTFFWWGRSIIGCTASAALSEVVAVCVPVAWSCAGLCVTKILHNYYNNKANLFLLGSHFIALAGRFVCSEALLLPRFPARLREAKDALWRRFSCTWGPEGCRLTVATHASLCGITTQLLKNKCNFFSFRFGEWNLIN